MSSAQVLQFIPPKPTPGEAYAEVWKGYCNAMKRHQEAMNALRMQEIRDMDYEEGYLSVVGDMSNRDLNHTLGKFAAQIIQRLSWRAARVFAPKGGRLEIDDHALSSAFPVSEHDDDKVLDSFDPTAVWAWLESRYGGQAGEDIACAQTAKRIESEFWRSLEEGVVNKGAYIVLSKSVYTDSWSSRTELSYSSQQDIRNAMLALSEIANWADRKALSDNLRWHVDYLGRNRTLTSREKFAFGDNEIILITFKTSFEFRLRNDFAAQLQVFLATYGKASKQQAD